MRLDDDAKAWLKLLAPIAIAYLSTLALALFIGRWFGVF